MTLKHGADENKTLDYVRHCNGMEGRGQNHVSPQIIIFLWTPNFSTLRLVTTYIL